MTDQNNAYPAHVVIHDHAESPVKRWQACMDARVRPEHMAHTATPELIGNINHDYGKMADPWPTVSIDLGQYRVPYVQMVGRGHRTKPGFTSGHNDDRLYQAFPRGKKFVTRVYLHGMWIKTMVSKRRKTAIRKGEEWIGRQGE